MKISELIAQLQSMNPETVVVADIWSSDDIRAAGEHLENLSDEQCCVVIEYLNQNSDSEYGINNDRINRIVNNLIESNELDYTY